jgi:hypothetical protein
MKTVATYMPFVKMTNNDEKKVLFAYLKVLALYLKQI